MNIIDQTIQICKENDINPARSKGQNFLINEMVYDEIVLAAELTKDDVVLEVGPGLGFLTRKLAQKAKKVIAVELDDKLAKLLEISLKNEGIGNVEVVNENILDFNFKFQISNFNSNFNDLILNSEKDRKLEINNSASVQNLNIKIRPERSALEVQNFKIVANLPYNITSIFLRKFLESENRPNSMVLMLQKEVAERIAAKPGKMSLLAVSVQCYAESEILFNVPASDFWPSPKVDSAVIKIQVPSSKLQVSSEKDFFRLVKFGFSAKRKMLKNNLSAGYQISQKEAGERIVKAGFKETARAQELSVEDWVNLLNYFS